MKEQFVTYDIALKLKELDFNEECLGYYNNNHILCVGKYVSPIEYDYEDQINYPNLQYLAPLWQQAQRWLREKHNIDIIITSNLIGYGHLLYNRYPPKNITNNRVFQYYEEALEDAILKALELCKKN